MLPKDFTKDGNLKQNVLKTIKNKMWLTFSTFYSNFFIPCIFETDCEGKIYKSLLGKNQCPQPDSPRGRRKHCAFAGHLPANSGTCLSMRQPIQGTSLYFKLWLWHDVWKGHEKHVPALLWIISSVTSRKNAALQELLSCLKLLNLFIAKILKICAEKSLVLQRFIGKQTNKQCFKQNQ